MNKCSFCSEITMDEENNLFNTMVSQYINMSHRFLYKTKNWLLIPALGSFIAGYLLIITEKHFLSIGSVPTYLLLELECLLQTVDSLLKNIYKLSTIAFEHGAVTDENLGGCCVNHTHLHILPYNGDILPDIIDDGFEVRKIDSFYDLKMQYLSHKPYIFYQNNHGIKYIIEGKNIPSQYIRQILADKLGVLENWNWKEYIGIDYIVDTFNRLNSVDINSIYMEILNKYKGRLKAW